MRDARADAAKGRLIEKPAKPAVSVGARRAVPESGNGIGNGNGNGKTRGNKGAT